MEMITKKLMENNGKPTPGTVNNNNEKAGISLNEAKKQNNEDNNNCCSLSYL